MSNAKTFDLIVIGTGTAGSTAALRCHSSDWSVALIDSSPFGGTCVLRGCDPKNVLVSATESGDWYQRMQSKTIKVFQVQYLRFHLYPQWVARRINKGTKLSV